MAFRIQVHLRSRGIEGPAKVIDQAAPVAAILLAAGNSMRMGSPKPLLEWRGETFLARQIRLYQAASCAVHIVLGRDAETIASACPSAQTGVLLLNPEPDRGMLSSLKIALAALPAATPAALFTPVDNPGVSLETLRSMLRLWQPHAARRWSSPATRPVAAIRCCSMPAQLPPCWHGRTIRRRRTSSALSTTLQPGPMSTTRA